MKNVRRGESKEKCPRGEVPVKCPTGGIQGEMSERRGPGEMSDGGNPGRNVRGSNVQGKCRVGTSREGRSWENVRWGQCPGVMFEGRKSRGRNVVHPRHGGLLGRTGSLPLFAVRSLSGNRCVCLPTCSQRHLSGGHETDHTHRAASTGRYLQKFDSARFMS